MWQHRVRLGSAGDHLLIMTLAICLALVTSLFLLKT